MTSNFYYFGFLRLHTVKAIKKYVKFSLKSNYKKFGLFDLSG